MKLIKVITAIFFMIALLFAVSPDLIAQDYDYYRFEPDTTTNADTLTFTFPYEIPTAASYQWVVTVEELSGDRTSGVINLLSAAGRGASAGFVSVATDSSNTDTYFQGTAYGLQQKLQIITGGTQTSEYRAYVVYKKQ